MSETKNELEIYITFERAGMPWNQILKWENVISYEIKWKEGKT